MTFPEWIALASDWRSRWEMAHESGFDLREIDELVDGHRVPTIAELHRLASALDTPCQVTLQAGSFPVFSVPGRSPMGNIPA